MSNQTITISREELKDKFLNSSQEEFNTYILNLLRESSLDVSSMSQIIKNDISLSQERFCEYCTNIAVAVGWGDGENCEISVCRLHMYMID